MQSLSSFRAPDTNKTFGIEWEVCYSNFFNPPPAVYGTYIKFFYVTSDGSIHCPIEGSWWTRELVSQPLPPRWLVKEMARLARALELTPFNPGPGQKSYRNQTMEEMANDSCGIHIHINRKWLNEAKAKLIFDWWKALSKEDKIQFFGRDTNSYCKPHWKSSRYDAINLTNLNTIEFRMFSSGGLKWAQWCVLFTEYLINNAKRLNIHAVQAFYDSYWK